MLHRLKDIILKLEYYFGFLIFSCQKDQNRKETFGTAEDLFAAMKARNDSSWFQHYTFKQHTIFFDTTGKKTDLALWFEAVTYPDLFRIDRSTVEYYEILDHLNQ